MHQKNNHTTIQPYNHTIIQSYKSEIEFAKPDKSRQEHQSKKQRERTKLPESDKDQNEMRKPNEKEI